MNEHNINIVVKNANFHPTFLTRNASNDSTVQWHFGDGDLASFKVSYQVPDDDGVHTTIIEQFKSGEILYFPHGSSITIELSELDAKEVYVTKEDGMPGISENLKTTIGANTFCNSIRVHLPDFIGDAIPSPLSSPKASPKHSPVPAHDDIANSLSTIIEEPDGFSVATQSRLKDAILKSISTPLVASELVPAVLDEQAGGVGLDTVDGNRGDHGKEPQLHSEISQAQIEALAEYHVKALAQDQALEKQIGIEARAIPVISSPVPGTFTHVGTGAAALSGTGYTHVGRWMVTTHRVPVADSHCCTIL